jgi:hypothetical protein
MSSGHIIFHEQREVIQAQGALLAAISCCRSLLLLCGSCMFPSRMTCLAARLTGGLT